MLFFLFRVNTIAADKELDPAIARRCLLDKKPQRNLYFLSPGWAESLDVIIQSQIQDIQATLESKNTQLWNLSDTDTN